VQDLQKMKTTFNFQAYRIHFSPNNGGGVIVGSFLYQKKERAKFILEIKK
jgi:hypothetical protein